MKKTALALALVSLVASYSQAFEPEENEQIQKTLSTVAVTFSPTLLTQLPTYSTQEISDKKKLIAAAQEDIFYFVASNGQTRTAKFEGAMLAARELTGSQAQDMDLAQAVLADIH